MTHSIVMPELSAGVEEGTVARWLKRVGDVVAVGDVIAEIETDKATIELEAKQAGVICEITVTEGTTVSVNSPIALLRTDDEPAGDLGGPVASDVPDATFHADTTASTSAAVSISTSCPRTSGPEPGMTTDRCTRLSTSTPSPWRGRASLRASS